MGFFLYLPVSTFFLTPAQFINLNVSIEPGVSFVPAWGFKSQFSSLLESPFFP